MCANAISVIHGHGNVFFKQSLKSLRVGRSMLNTRFVSAQEVVKN